jgi:hypothetical protein
MDNLQEIFTMTTGSNQPHKSTSRSNGQALGRVWAGEASKAQRDQFWGAIKAWQGDRYAETLGSTPVAEVLFRYATRATAGEPQSFDTFWSGILGKDFEHVNDDSFILGVVEGVEQFFADGTAKWRPVE